jgi:hypothetical protein
MKRYNMQINVDKTEYATLTRDKHATVKLKFLGTQLNIKDEIATRKTRARQAMRVMRGVWKQEHIRENIRVHMYKACVEPHLLYNIAPVPVTAAGAEELDREQRRLMRVALGI